MSMNILSWIAIAILIIYAVNGMRRGLVRTVFSTVTILVAIIIAVNMSSWASRTLQQTQLFDYITEYVENALFEDDGAEEENESAETIRVTEQTEIIQNLPLPENIKESLLENNNNQIYDALGITAFKAYVANYIACMIVNALSFILVFLLAVIVLKIIGAALNIISYLPVLHTLNKVGGLVIGGINGLIILWIICIAATIFSGTEWGRFIYEQINESVFLQLIYNNNYMMNIVTSLKYLLV